MTLSAPSQFVTPAPAAAISRRGLLKAGLGLTGVAGVVMPGTAAYAAAEAANDLVVTDYRPMPPSWPESHHLTITVIADCMPAAPIWGSRACARWSMPRNALNSDLIVSCSAIISPPIVSSPNACRIPSGRRNLHV